MLFRQAPAKKEKTARLKKARAEANEEIREIKKLADPIERLTRYETVRKKLRGFYDSGKPEAISREGIVDGGVQAGIGGIALGSLICVAVPPLAGPVILGLMGGGLVLGAAGGAGLGGFFGGQEKRKELRSKYGSIRNARAMYRLQETVEKKVTSELRNASVREHFNETYNKKETAAAPAAKAGTLRSQPRQLSQ